MEKMIPVLDTDEKMPGTMRYIGREAVSGNPYALFGKNGK